MHLTAPASTKMFFISPPPSPPHGWEMRNEDAPNKVVHATDIEAALTQLQNMISADARWQSDPTRSAADEEDTPTSRPRAGSTTIVYDPEHHGHATSLPMVVVENTSPEDEDKESARPIMAHTARPPVELMMGS